MSEFEADGAWRGKTYDVVALGELLIDFTMNGMSGQGNPMYEANPGGAPCNVLSMLRQLGKKTAFIGKVGADSFGDLLVQAVAGQGIATQGIRRDEKIPTSLAFVHTMPDGDRSFSFYRNPGADQALRKEEVDTSLVEDTRIFHFGSLSMTGREVEEATRLAVDTAKQAGALISFDPNLRPPLWEELSLAKEKIAYGISQCHILKIADDEIAFFTGTDDIDEGASRIWGRFGTPLICATMGRAGSRAFFRGKRADCAPFLTERTIDATGAGDTFMACVLNWALERGFQEADEGELLKMLRFANAAASLVTTKKGALRSMPQKEAVMRLMRGCQEDGQDVKEKR